MIVACIALLVALGGTSVAAVSQLARNSVGTPQLRDGAVTNPKIRNNAVNSAKVAARSLLRSDFAPGQLRPVDERTHIDSRSIVRAVDDQSGEGELRTVALVACDDSPQA